MTTSGFNTDSLGNTLSPPTAYTCFLGVRSFSVNNTYDHFRKRRRSNVGWFLNSVDIPQSIWLSDSSYKLCLYIDIILQSPLNKTKTNAQELNGALNKSERRGCQSQVFYYAYVNSFLFYCIIIVSF